MKIVGYMENPDGTVSDVKLDNGKWYPMPAALSISQEDASKLPVRIQNGILFLGGVVTIEPDVVAPPDPEPVSVFEGTIVEAAP